MKHEIEEVLFGIKSAWRYRWVALLAAWILFIVGFVGVELMPDRFEAKALMYVDARTLLKSLLQGIAVSADANNDADVVRRTLLARPTLDRVARETGLYQRTGEGQEEVDRLLVRLSSEIKVNGSRDSGIYSISYTDRDPRMALNVVQHLLDAFVSKSKSSGKDNSDAARKFLAQQVSDYETQLRKSEEKLAAFKTRNSSLLPGAEGDYFQRLRTEQLNATQLATELKVANGQRDELLRKMAGVGDDGSATPKQPSAAAVTGAADLDGRIQASERQLDDLLQKDTEQHPDVLALRATIEQLKARRARDFGGIRASMAAIGPGDNGAIRGDAVMQDIQILMTKQDVQIAALKTQLAAAQQRLQALKDLVATEPQIEAEYTQLNRDYGVTKAQYEQLLQRLESAKISGEASESEEVAYRLVEPPRLPVKPVAPRRPLFLAAVLFVAVCCGAGLAWILSQAKPVLMGAQALRAAFGLPVLGVVRLELNRSEAARVRSVAFLYGAGFTLLFMVAALAAVTARPVSLLLRGIVHVGVA